MFCEYVPILSQGKFITKKLQHPNNLKRGHLQLNISVYRAFL